MRIFVNGQEIAVKNDISFDYISENALFTGSDDYTLSFEIPVAGCPRNIAIFGSLDRLDSISGTISWDCDIYDREFHSKGALVLVSRNEQSIKVQFLEGRSAKNFNKSITTTCINTMELGEGPDDSNSSMTPEDALNQDNTRALNCVALPWVNDSSGSAKGKLHNPIIHNGSGGWKWEETEEISWMPYLLPLAEKIAEQAGFSHDFSQWESSHKRWLVVCNVLPRAWELRDFSRALPAWTVEEFFDKLELFLGCEFVYDFSAMKITCVMNDYTVESSPEVELDVVLDVHSSEIDYKETSAGFLPQTYMKYKDLDKDVWSVMACQWYVKNYVNKKTLYYPKRYSTLKALLYNNSEDATFLMKGKVYKDGTSTFERVGSEPSDRILPGDQGYAEDVGALFVKRFTTELVSQTPIKNGYEMIIGYEYTYKYTTWLVEVNAFPEVNRPDDESDTSSAKEVEFVPAVMDDTDSAHGLALFMPLGEFDEDVDPESGLTQGQINHGSPWAVMTGGDTGKKAEYYDRIFLAYWQYDYARGMGGGQMPLPANSAVMPLKNYTKHPCPYSMKLPFRAVTSGRELVIDPKEKYTVSFLYRGMPDTKAIFTIRGRQFLCKKITATMTTDGMSDLKKGEFYILGDRQA